MDDLDEYEFDVDPDMLQRMPWLETPLDPKNHCIRILKLHPGASDSPIVCSLQVVSLDDNPQYETLSYVWGDLKKTIPITVGGEIFNATNNLVDFLGCLRQESVDRFLWADAICIDQFNDEEKGQQIGLMCRIYRQAREAHIWFGRFTQSWTDEIKGESGGYIPACELTSSQWNQAEKMCHEELGHFLRAGGQAQQHEQEMLGLDAAIMSQTLTVLDEVAAGKHFHEFPLFLVTKDTPNRAGTYVMNRHWLVINDCYRWLLTRPWWTRVWTIQEAVLPRVDPIVHAYPYSFPLSRLLNGLKRSTDHGNDCCKRLGRLFFVVYLRSLFNYQIRARAVHDHREIFADSEEPWINLDDAIDSARGRNATVPQDLFYGTLGLLNPQLHEKWFATFGYSRNTTEIFSQCSKLLYDSCRSLSRLGEAKGVRGSEFRDLPSWAIDLSTEIIPSYDGNRRWELFDACPQSSFAGFNELEELAGEDFTLEAIPIGTVGACARRFSEYEGDLLDSPHAPDIIMRHVSEWNELYMTCARPPDFDSFWRAAFMDRNIWLYYMHKRNPLPARRLAEIKAWWQSWHETGENRDLQIDQQSGENNRGDYHYRALKLNFEKHRFFCTARGELGMGPMEAQPSDEIFVLHGCQAPVVLRRRVGINGDAGFLFVGLCFLDGWMYGRATLGRAQWQTVTLY